MVDFSISYAEISRYLTISARNDKIGWIYNTSFPPVESCVNNAPCVKKCYSLKSYRVFPTVKYAYNKNYRLYRDSHEHYFWLFQAWLQKRRPAYFRYFVGGDIPNQAYLDGMVKTAEMYSDTMFLAYTKKYMLDYTYAAKQANLQVIFSTWIDWPYEVSGLPIARVRMDQGQELPKNSIACAWKCDKCFVCWHLPANRSITFDIN